MSHPYQTKFYQTSSTYQKVHCGGIEKNFTFDDDDDNGCKVGRCTSLVQKREKSDSTFEGETSRKKEKSRIAVVEGKRRRIFLE